MFHQKEIIGHSRDEKLAVSEDEGKAVLNNGLTQNQHTTAGWSMHVKWKTGAMKWIPLKDVKTSYPVKTAVYAKSRGIHTAPKFASQLLSLFGGFPTQYASMMLLSQQ